MFVALTAYPEFFKEHMQFYIAIAPVMFLSNMSAEPFVIACRSDTMISLGKSMGPEMFPEPAGTNHPQLNNILATSDSAN